MPSFRPRLTTGTLDEAVSFYLAHGQRVRHGATIESVYGEYLEHLVKRGVGHYHLRDVKRYVGNFVAAFPGLISAIQTTAIDAYLSRLGGSANQEQPPARHHCLLLTSPTGGSGTSNTITGYTTTITLSSAELYDPNAGTSAATGTMNYTRVNHTAILLPNGKVLVAGGGSNTAEVFDRPPGLGRLSLR